MDEQPPVPDQPTSPSSYEAGAAAHAPVTPESRANRARVTALILTILVVLTGGGTALLLRASNTTQSLDRFVPDTTAAYIKFSLKPSLQQQQRVQDLLSRFPSSVRGDFVKNFTKGFDDGFNKASKGVKLSFENDIKSWVGSQIVLALLAPNEATSDSPSNAPIAVAIVSVKDAAAAQKALAKVKSSSPQRMDFKIEGGVAYVSDSQNAITSFQNAVTSGHTLADNASYKREHDRAGGDGLVFAYADLSKLAGLAPALRGDILGTSGFTGGSGVVSFGMHAEPDGVAVTGHSSFPTSQTGAKGGQLKLLPTTPDDLLGSVSFFDLGDLVGNALTRLSKGVGLLPISIGSPVPGLPEVTGVLKEFEQALGINLQKDLLPWLKGELSIVVAPAANPPFPNVGILIEPTNEAALGRTMKALRTHLGRLLGAKAKVVADANGLTIKPVFGPEVVIRVASGRVVIATGGQFAQQLLHPSGSTLSNDTIYKASVDPSKPTVFQLFVRLDRVRALIEGLAKLSDPNGYAEYERKVQPAVKPLEALGIQTTIDGNSQDFRLILTIAKP